MHTDPSVLIRSFRDIWFPSFLRSDPDAIPRRLSALFRGQTTERDRRSAALTGETKTVVS